VQRGRETLGCQRRQALQQRQREAGGLAGAGLRGAQQIASRKDDRNGLRLDRGGFCVTLLRDCAQQLGQQPEAFERRADDYLLKNRPGEGVLPSTPVQADENDVMENSRGREAIPWRRRLRRGRESVEASTG
jgi:hypothetical protein